MPGKNIEASNSTQPYSVTEIAIKDNNQRAFTLHVFDFPSSLASAKGDPKIQKLYDDVVDFSHRDDIFPKTRPGEILEEALIESVNETSILVTCTLPGSDAIVGYCGFTRKQFGKLSDLHIGLAGVASEYKGGGLAYHMREQVISEENPDIIEGQTVNPGILHTYQRVAESFGYELYPQDIHPPKEVVAFARRLLRRTSSKAASEQLDDMMVRRHYLPDTPTGKEVWKGDPLFEAMHVTKEDGAQLMLVKPGIIPRKGLRRFFLTHFSI